MRSLSPSPDFRPHFSPFSASSPRPKKLYGSFSSIPRLHTLQHIHTLYSELEKNLQGNFRETLRYLPLPISGPFDRTPLNLFTFRPSYLGLEAELAKVVSTNHEVDMLIYMQFEFQRNVKSLIRSQFCPGHVFHVEVLKKVDFLTTSLSIIECRQQT